MNCLECGSKTYLYRGPWVFRWAKYCSSRCKQKYWDKKRPPGRRNWVREYHRARRASRLEKVE